MKKIFVFTCLSIAVTACYDRKINIDNRQTNSGCLESFDSIPISKLIQRHSYFWMVDSFGSDGYRMEVLKYIRQTKVYNVDYDFVVKNFVNGIQDGSFVSNASHVYLVYYTFNTFKMGPKFEKTRIKDEVIFDFDPKSKKLLSIKLNAS